MAKYLCIQDYVYQSTFTDKDTGKIGVEIEHLEPGIIYASHDLPAIVMTRISEHGAFFVDITFMDEKGIFKACLKHGVHLKCKDKDT